MITQVTLESHSRGPREGPVWLDEMIGILLCIVLTRLSWTRLIGSQDESNPDSVQPWFCAARLASDVPFGTKTRNMEKNPMNLQFKPHYLLVLLYLAFGMTSCGRYQSDGRTKESQNENPRGHVGYCTEGGWLPFGNGQHGDKCEENLDCAEALECRGWDDGSCMNDGPESGACPTKCRAWEPHLRRCSELHPDAQRVSSDSSCPAGYHAAENQEFWDFAQLEHPRTTDELCCVPDDDCSQADLNLGNQSAFQCQSLGCQVAYTGVGNAFRCENECPIKHN